MCNLSKVDTILKSVDVRINFENSDTPLVDFEGLTIDSFDFRSTSRCIESWVFPQSSEWLNLHVPVNCDNDRDLSFSVTTLEDGRFCIFVHIYKAYILSEFRYYEEDELEDVFKLVISILQRYGNAMEIGKYVKIEIEGFE